VAALHPGGRHVSYLAGIFIALAPPCLLFWGDLQRSPYHWLHGFKREREGKNDRKKTRKGGAKKKERKRKERKGQKEGERNGMINPLSEVRRALHGVQDSVWRWPDLVWGFSDLEMTWLVYCAGAAIGNNKKFKLMLTKRAKAYSSFCSQTVSQSPVHSWSVRCSRKSQ